MSFRNTSTSELQAVNTLLSIIGEAPVNSITGNTGVDVSIALQLLDETNVEVQSRGWHFNTEEEVTLSINDDSKIPVAANVVQAVASRNYQNEFNITLRNGFLYDLTNKTDIFTKVPPVDQISVEQFEHIPEYARRLIVTKAGRRFQARMVGSKELAGYTEIDEQEAIINCERADAQQGDYNILSGNMDVYNIINRTVRRSY
jgi:hypothetical protein